MKIKELARLTADYSNEPIATVMKILRLTNKLLRGELYRVTKTIKLI